MFVFRLYWLADFNKQAFFDAEFPYAMYDNPLWI